MASPTRRNILKTAAVISGAAVLPKAVKASVEGTAKQTCLACGANLETGDLHRPDCEAVRIAFPLDEAIQPENLKIAGKAYGQTSSGAKRSGDSDSCEQLGCDRCKIQRAAKGGVCYHKNKFGCAVQTQC